MVYATYLLGFFLILSALGVILAKKPVHACLSFLLTLLTLAVVYLELDAQFVAVMQVLVYAGAILVIFMFVVVLFQDAHEQLANFAPLSSYKLLLFAAISLLTAFSYLGYKLLYLPPINNKAADAFGTVEALGEILYIDFFFPFEAVIALFLVAIVGSIYIAKKIKG